MDSLSRNIPTSDDRQQLEGKVAVVTGAGRGLGKHIALALAYAGAHVVCLARSKQELDQIVSQIAESMLPTAIAVVADLTRLSDITRALRIATQKFGRIDVLVNNAGIDRIGSLQHESNFPSWWRVFEVNMMGPAAMIHEALPSMIERNNGVIINIGSRNAIFNFPFMSAYSASKTALLRFSQCLHMELEHTNVVCFYLQPGDVPSSLMDGAHNPEEASKVPRLQAMLELMQSVMESADEVSAKRAADLCVRLASDNAVKVLSGMYIDVEQSIDELIVEAGGDGKIRRQDLQSLKADLI